MDTTPYYIYLAKVGDSDIHKIGYSSDLKQRIKGLETYARQTFEISGVAYLQHIECPTLFIVEVESRLHKFYRKFKVAYTKEWFELTDKQVSKFSNTYSEIYKQVCDDYPDEALAPRVYYGAECVEYQMRKDILAAREDLHDYRNGEWSPAISRDRRLRAENNRIYQREMAIALGGYFRPTFSFESEG